MRDYLNFISTTPNGIKDNQGVGYIISLGKNSADIKKYIKNSFLKTTVTIALENGGFIENVPVLKHVWNDLEFPDSNKKLGSCIFWNKVPYLNNILVVGVITKNNDVLNQYEHQFSLHKEFEKNYIEISGDAKNGRLNLTVDGGTNNGELEINVANNSNSAKLRLVVKGNMIVDIDGKTDFYVNDGIAIRNKDESLKTIFDDLLLKLENAILTGGSGPYNFGPTAKNDLKVIGQRINKLLNAS